MTQEFHTQRRIEFRDTDSAGIAHFTAFFYLMEEAEHELLRSLGLSVLARDDEGPISWPRVSAHCDFRRAVKFEDVVDVFVRIERRGAKSVSYAFRFELAGQTVAEGTLTAVCCRLSPDGPPRSIAIPRSIVDRLDTMLTGGASLPSDSD